MSLRRRIVVSACVSVAIVSCISFVQQGSIIIGRRLAAAAPTSYEENDDIPPYGQTTIEEAYAHGMNEFETSLLVFDGSTFSSYALGYKFTTFRSVKPIPLLVNALKTNYPERFQPGQPIFQLAWTVADFLVADCVNSSCESTKIFPPILRSTAPCKWPSVDESLQFDDLVPTIIWRGSDFRGFIHSYDANKAMSKPWMGNIFTKEAMDVMSKAQIIDTLFKHYEELTPRWRAVTMALEAKENRSNSTETPVWIDAIFSGEQHKASNAMFGTKGLYVAEASVMNEKTMSKYRYQIDLGGGGGTTWQGTLSKLRMSGVLFHHETLTKDWFYDLMEPWKHYIPVDGSLLNLKRRYE